MRSRIVKRNRLIVVRRLAGNAQKSVGPGSNGVAKCHLSSELLPPSPDTSALPRTNYSSSIASRFTGRNTISARLFPK